MVETAILFPVLLLTVFLFFALALSCYEQVSSDCLLHKDSSVLENTEIFPEDLLRVSWVIAQTRKKKDTEKKEEKVSHEE